MAQSFEDLPARERAARYRQVAAEISRQGSSTAFSDLKPTFNNLALRWIALAEEVERGIERHEVSAMFGAVASSSNGGPGRN